MSWKLAVLLTVILVPAALLAADRTEGEMFATRSVVHARHGMVAAAHPLAVQIGVDMLQEGGSAVDAAIARQRRTGLPRAGLLRHRRRPVRHRLGRREREAVRPERLRPGAALALTADKVPPEPDGTIPLYSPYAWTRARHGGRLVRTARAVRPPADGRDPRAGHPRRERGRAGAAGHRRGLEARARGSSARCPGFAATFLPGGKAPREGEIFRNPGLARSLPADRRAAGGTRSTAVPIAEAIVAFSERHGGFFTMEDFAAARLGVGRADLDRPTAA